MPKPDFSVLRGRDDYRLATMTNGARPVNWSILDTYVRMCTRAGHLKELSQVTLISIHTLRQRRKELGMPPMGAGRPRTLELSTSQKQLLFKFNQGKRMTKIAEELGTTPQAQYQAFHRAVNLSAPCGNCETKGVVLCGSPQDKFGTPCNGNRVGPHSHVCLDCNGEGYLPKKEEKTK